MAVVKLRWRRLKSGAQSYYLDYHYRGKRYREFLKLHLKYHDEHDRHELLKLAKEAQRLKINQLTSQDLEIDSLVQGQVSFVQHFSKYIAEYQGKDIRKLDACFKHLKLFLCDNLGIEDIRKNELTESVQREFKKYLAASVGSETVRSYMGVLRKVIRGEQFSRKEVREDTLAKQILTDQEIHLLAKVPCGNDEVKRAFLLSCYTGFGLAECKELEWKHVLDDRISIRRRKTGNELNIPIQPSTKNLLGKPKEGKIFNIPTSNGANKAIKNWVARAGIDKKITFYCARHSYAVRLLNQGTDQQTLSHLMGHKGTRQLRKYLNHVDTAKRRAIERLPDLEL